MSVAKTVSHSPLRPNPSLKNVLDNPLKAKWPVLSQTAALQIRKQLESSLGGLTYCSRKQTKRKSKIDHGNKERPAKRVCSTDIRDDSTDVHGSKSPTVTEGLRDSTSVSSTSLASAVPTQSSTDSQPKESQINIPQCVLQHDDDSDIIRAKMSQLVVGVNVVTRLLEHGALEAGLLCSTSPGLLCQHLLPLVATRGVPFAALPDLSDTVARLLGIKRAMCIGWKKVSDSSTNHFTELSRIITDVAPSVTLPWLALTLKRSKPATNTKTTAEEAELLPLVVKEAGGKPQGELMATSCSTTMEGKGRGGVVYCPLQVKRTKFFPNSKKKSKNK